MNPRRRLALALSSLLVTACLPNQEPADLVLRGGKIITLDEGQPQVEALAARDGRIVYVGDDEGVERWIGDETNVVRLDGLTAIPGLIEGHGHFYGLGETQLQLDLTQAQSWDEIVGMVEEAVAEAEPGAWVQGRGWHQSKWSSPPAPSVEGMPLHASLSAVSPENPVLLTHASGHASFVNGRALELAGIDAETADPEGGEIVRDSQGEATGALRETAQGLVGRVAAEAFDEQHARRVIELAGEESLRHGITTFHDAGSSFELAELFREMAEAGELPVRLWVMIRTGNEELAEKLASHRVIGAGDGFLTVRGIKKSIDGALGSHGAWLLEPYEDLPESAGLNTTSVAEVEGAAKLALEHGYQLCVHAIGDRANRETLDIYAAAFDEAAVEGQDLRWRIEHAQHLAPEDVPRFAELGVIASIQAVHATSDGPWVPDRLGDERSEEGAYVWRSLLDSGATLINGTDAPVEPVSAIASYAAAVTRVMKTGEPFYPEQKMTRMEALRAYTINAAYAAFEEDEKGSLVVGKLADVTVLSQDLLSVPDDDLMATEVVYTIVGGDVRYQR